MVTLAKRTWRYFPEHVVSQAEETLMEYYHKEHIPELHKMAEQMAFYYTLGGLACLFANPYAFDQIISPLPTHHQQLEAIAEFYMEFEGNAEYYEAFLHDLEYMLLNRMSFYVVRNPIPLHHTQYIETVNAPIRSVW